jgi:hypothetical protein
MASEQSGAVSAIMKAKQSMLPELFVEVMHWIWYYLSRQIFQVSETALV